MSQHPSQHMISQLILLILTKYSIDIAPSPGCKMFAERSICNVTVRVMGHTPGRSLSAPAALANSLTKPKCPHQFPLCPSCNTLHCSDKPHIENCWNIHTHLINELLIWFFRFLFRFFLLSFILERLLHPNFLLYLLMKKLMQKMVNKITTS